MVSVRDPGVGDSARHDDVVGVEAVVDVERESVHRDAARYPDADGTHLAVGAMLVSGIQTPLRPSTRSTGTPKSAQMPMSTASTRRT